MPIDPAILARVKAKVEQGAQAPAPTGEKSVKSPEDFNPLEREVAGLPPESTDIGEMLRLPLVAGSLVGMIPHPITRGVGAASTAALGLLGARDVAKDVSRGDYKQAGIDATFTALSGVGAVSYLKSLARSIPSAAKALDPLAQRAEQIARLEQEVQRVRGPAKAAKIANIDNEKRLLAAEVRRALREGRLAARALTRAGKPVPKELQEQITQNAQMAQQQAKALSSEQAAVKAPRARKVKPPTPPTAESNTVVEGMKRTNQPQELIRKVEESLKAPTKTRKQARAKSELGMSFAELMVRMGATAAGAAAGGAAGVAVRPEDAERSPLQYGLAGAAAGALGANALTALALTSGSKASKLIDFNYFSLLSAPGTIGRVALGGVGAAVTAAATRAAEGRFADASRIIRTLLSPATTALMFRVAKDPWTHLPRQLRVAGKVPLKPGILGTPTRAIAAIDAASSKAIMSGGYSRMDAMRLNLSGDPQTQIGRDFLAFFGVPSRAINPITGRARTIKPAKWTQTELGQLAARFLVPFPRVTVAVPEKLVEYSPLQALPGVRRAFNLNPASTAEALTKAAAGPVLGGGLGYGIAKSSDPDVDPLSVALGGPLAGWVEIGQRLARGEARDIPSLATINRVIQGMPLVAEQLSAASPLERAVPSFLRDIARAEDPAFGREKGPTTIAEFASAAAQGELPPGGELATTLLAPAAARFPVLREALPESPMPVDVFGKQLFPDRPKYIPDITLRGFGGEQEVISVTFPKIATSTPQENPPIFPPDNRTAQAVRDVQRATPHLPEILSPPAVVQSPRVREALAVSGKKEPQIPRDIRRSAQRVRGGTIEIALQKVVQSPQFQKMSPEIQNIMLRRIISQARGETDVIGSMAAGSAMAPSSQDSIRAALRQWVKTVESQAGR